MLNNYLKIAFRNLVREKGYTLINIGGLALGMACFILILLWVRDELSYDRFHRYQQRIYKVLTETESGNMITHSSWRLGPALKARYPEIDDFCRIRFQESSPVKYGDKIFVEQDFFLADPSLFTMFSFPFIQGNPQTALKELNSLVMTETTARRYFGNAEPLGQVVFVARYQADFVITGVIRDIPENSHIRFDMVTRLEWMGNQRLESWEFTGFTYLLLKEAAQPEALSQKMVNFYREEVNPESTYRPLLQPLNQVHLYEWGVPGIVQQVRMFSLIALFILLIAGINFMNLSSARSARRAREIGLRKVNGATRGQLIGQFIGESLLLSGIALLLALALVELLLPGFNRFTGKSLRIAGSSDRLLLPVLAALPLVTGILAGLYPAFLLSSFHPARILRGQLASQGNGSRFRRLLVIVQFAIAIGLIVSTAVIFQQLHYVQEKDLGFNRDRVMTIALPDDPALQRQYDPFKNALRSIPGVQNVSASASLPIRVGEWIGIDWEGNPEEDFLPVNYTMVDYDFFETFQMEIVQGRSFSMAHPGDESTACIINESALRAMGLADPLGTPVYFAHPAFPESLRQVEIIGVVKDFHFRSLHRDIGPFIFRIYRPWLFNMYVRIAPEQIPETLEKIAATARQAAPGYPFRYTFLDDEYRELYQSEQQMGQLMRIFGFLAITISCLGLLGLAAHTTTQRTREIGVRKVLGASVSAIVLRLTGEFIRWVLLANLIAWPMAYIFLHRWLADFSYRIHISIWNFLMAGALTLFIAVLTVSYQAIKAARANPVVSLRHE